MIGDFDSLENNDIEELELNGVQVIRHPSRKDFTDLELAVNHAVELGVQEIVIVAALGARWDQTIANILLPTLLPSVRIKLLDGHQEIQYISSGESAEIDGQQGDTVSLIPLAGDVTGITTEGLEYPLDDAVLYFGSTRGVSNELMGETGRIFVGSGTLLCILIHQIK